VVAKEQAKVDEGLAKLEQLQKQFKAGCAASCRPDGRAGLFKTA
jgi:hypothetical protein